MNSKFLARYHRSFSGDFEPDHVARGQVTRAAVLPISSSSKAIFVAKDVSGRFDRVMLMDILLIKRPTCANASDPKLGEWVIAVKWLSGCPKKAKRIAGMPEPEKHRRGARRRGRRRIFSPLHSVLEGLATVSECKNAEPARRSATRGLR